LILHGKDQAVEKEKFMTDDKIRLKELELENRGRNPVDILISALDQSSGTDALSAPRVMTRSGEEAAIRVGELHSYDAQIFIHNIWQYL